MTARGIRNHNPGNIRLSGDKWQGLAQEQTDTAFFQFESPAWGIRALGRVLISYQDKHKLSTIRDIISRWAPDNENDTLAYINAVTAETGFNADLPLQMHDYTCMEPLLKAIIKHENGGQPYTQAQIDKGLVLAGVEPPVRPSRTFKGGQLAAGSTVFAMGAEALDALSPHVSWIDKLAEFAPWAFGVLALAGIGWMVRARLDDRQKGLR